MNIKKMRMLMSRLQNYLGAVYLAILWLTKSGVRSKLMTVCKNEHEVRRKMAGKTPQIILQVALMISLYQGIDKIEFSIFEASSVDNNISTSKAIYDNNS